MDGIEKTGVHIPRYRLGRKDIAGMWGGRAGSGERSVANYDEDAITMAVEAAAPCLDGIDRDTIDMVVLASTTQPYLEKQGAAVVAEALDLRPGIDTLDISSSLRCGTQALRVGLNALAGGARRVLVAVSDLRKGQAGSKSEAEMGDGAVAFLLGPDAVVALRTLRIEFNTAMDRWRLPGDDFVRQGDERFTSKVLFQDGVSGAIRAALSEAGLQPSQIHRIAVAGVDRRASVATAAAAGFDATAVAGEAVYERAGHCGAAAGLLNLVAGLEDARQGDQVVLANYGDGTDVLLATAHAAQPFGTPVSNALAGGKPLAYAQFLRFKGLVENEKIEPYTSEISIWRDAAHLVRLHAPRCKHCGTIQFPPRRICSKCHAKDQFTDVALSKLGTLFTFTVEHLFPIPDTKLVTGVVDLSDGARLFTQMTDCSAEEVQIGMGLRLTFRALHRGGGFHHYFWTAAPAGA